MNALLTHAEKLRWQRS